LYKAPEAHLDSTIRNLSELYQVPAVELRAAVDYTDCYDWDSYNTVKGETVVEHDGVIEVKQHVPLATCHVCKLNRAMRYFFLSKDKFVCKSCIDKFKMHSLIDKYNKTKAAYDIETP
jgi:hypothetical protein